jgi:hypothetical protein
MRKHLFGLAAALVAGLLVTAPPAQAQGLSVTFSTGANPTYVPVPARPVAVYRPAPVYRAAPFYRHPRRVHYRPMRPPHRCVTRMERYWDGWAWAERPARFCR